MLINRTLCSPDLFLLRILRMKTSIYAFLTEKWLEENTDGLKSVFMDRKNQATYEAMVENLGSDSMYEQKTLEKLYSEIRTWTWDKDSGDFRDDGLIETSRSRLAQ